MLPKELNSDDDVYFKVILPDVKPEKAVDDGGIMRDVHLEFWSDL